MRWRAAVVGAAAIAASTAALIVFTPAVELPARPTPADIQAMQDKASDDWWRVISADAPPVVRRVQYVTPAQQGELVSDCLDHSVVNSSTDQSMALWVCTQRYPIDPASPELADSLFTTAQLEYLYDYFEKRLVPCLRTQGYEVKNQQTHDQFMAASVGYPNWDPYFSLAPAPQRPAEWAVLAARCPPPFGGEVLLPQQPPGSRPVP